MTAKVIIVWTRPGDVASMKFVVVTRCRFLPSTPIGARSETICERLSCCDREPGVINHHVQLTGNRLWLVASGAVVRHQAGLRDNDSVRRPIETVGGVRCSSSVRELAGTPTSGAAPLTVELFGPIHVPEREHPHGRSRFLFYSAGFVICALMRYW